MWKQKETKPERAVSMWWHLLIVWEVFSLLFFSWSKIVCVIEHEQPQHQGSLFFLRFVLFVNDQTKLHKCGLLYALDNDSVEKLGVGESKRLVRELLVREGRHQAVSLAGHFPSRSGNNRQTCNLSELQHTIGAVRITSWYPTFNGRHFELPPALSTEWLVAWQLRVNYDVYRPHFIFLLNPRICLQNTKNNNKKKKTPKYAPNIPLPPCRRQ